MKKIKVGVLGPRGSNGELAFQSFSKTGPAFGLSTDGWEPVFMGTHDEILEAVECRRLRYGVVAVENCSEGYVKEVLDFWADRRRRCSVVGECHVAIRHNLIGHRECLRIKTLVADNHGRAQCRRTLSGLAMLKGSAFEAALSTSAAVARVAESSFREGKVAIGSAFAAQSRGLSIIRADIHDHPLNATRFHLVASSGSTPAPRWARSKAAIVFKVRHEVGQLVEPQLVLRSFGCNMECIHSIPTGKPRDFVFYLELDRPKSQWKPLFKEIKKVAQRVRVVGKFPLMLE